MEGVLFNSPSCLPKDDCYDDCYDPVDSLEISLFDDACYAYGQDANMNYAYGYELAIVAYVKHEICAIAPTHDSPIIFLNSLDYTITRIGLQNKTEQTYDRDFVRSFRGGAHTGSIVQHHHVQGSAHDIRSVPEPA